jgi:hypothetical protein
LFHQFDLDANNVLDHKEIGNVNATLFNIFPRFGYKGKEPPGEILLQCNHIFYYDIFLCDMWIFLSVKHAVATNYPHQPLNDSNPIFENHKK